MQALRQITLKAFLALGTACFLTGAVPVFGAVQDRDVKTGVLTEQEDQETEEDSFDAAIDALYEQSGSLTDAEILELTREIVSDDSKLYSELEEKDAASASAALAAYEDSKADYIRARINDAGGTRGQAQKPEEVIRSAVEKAANAKDAVSAAKAAEKEPAEAAESVDEWDLQSAYTSLLIGENTAVREMIPRYRVTSCACKGGVLQMDVEEWMTQGCGAADGSGPVSASAYSYTFTLSMRRSEEDQAWTPFAINGTECNYTWLREETDPVSVTQEAPASLYAVQSELGGQTVAYAQIGLTAEDAERTDASDPAGDGGSEPGGLSFAVDESAAVLPQASGPAEDSDGTADAQMYSADTGAYTYSAAQAVAYADKYWKNYNRSYREYRGVDCANFVSQCLFAGGMPKTSDWYPQSVNWINVMGHIRHFKSYGSFVTASSANVYTGNPVYYDWNGDGTYDHTAICVGTNAGGVPVVDAHTSNVYHAVWSMGSSGRRGTILLRTASRFRYELSSSPALTVQTNIWKTVGGKVYYLGSDGAEVRSRFLTIDGKRYYFNASGERVTGFFKVGSRWYYADPSTGALATGWKKISGNYYYFSKKAWYRLSGGRKKIGNYYYFFNNSGVRQVSFLLIGTKWYYADRETGRFVTGWKKIHGEWYYFDKTTMVKAIGWKTIDGQKCYFDSNGILKKGRHG